MVAVAVTQDDGVKPVEVQFKLLDVVQDGVLSLAVSNKTFLEFPSESVSSMRYDSPHCPQRPGFRTRLSAMVVIFRPVTLIMTRILVVRILTGPCSTFSNECSSLWV